MDLPFDFTNLAIVLGSVSLALVALSWIASGIMPDWANQNKQTIQRVIAGFVLFTVISLIVSALSG